MDKTVLVLDIGSSSVGGDLILHGKDGGRTMFSRRERIPFHEEIDAERLLSLTMRSLDMLLEEIFRKHLPVPKKIFCLLSSPWYVSEMRTALLSKDIPFTFTAKLADELLKKETSLLSADSGLEPIELKTLKTTLNGYQTASPHGQKAKELNMEIFISLAPEKILRKIRDSANKHFPGADIKFSSFSFAAFAAARDMFPKDDFILVDAGGEITDVAAVKGGGFAGIASFPIGSNALLRNISKSELSLYVSGHADTAVAGRIKPAIEGFMNEWLRQFEKTLPEISGNISVPSAVFLITEDGFEGIFSDAIRNESVHQYDWAENKFRVARLSKEMLKSLYLNRFF